MIKIKILLINIIIFIFLFFLFLEFLYPRIFDTPSLTYRFWNDRPVTFYPNKTMRAVTNNYDNYFKTNSLGFNDYEIKNEVDILIIGDSYVQAVEVERKDHFASLINNYFTNLKIMKIGISGYGNDKYLSSYLEVGKKYNPKMVIIFNVGNDIRNIFCDKNNSNCDSADNIKNIKNKNDLKKFIKFLWLDNLEYNFNIGKRSELSFREYLLREIISRFNSYYSLRHTITNIKKFREIKKNKIYSDDGFMKNYVDLSKNQIIFDYYKDINDLIYNIIVKRDKKKLLFVTINKDVRNIPNVAQNLINDSIAKSLDEKGYNHIYLDDIMRNFFFETNELPNWDNDEHWNKLGHKQVAEILIKYLKDNYFNN